jgi:hypothetical protein
MKTIFHQETSGSHWSKFLHPPISLLTLTSTIALLCFLLNTNVSSFNAIINNIAHGANKNEISLKGDKLCLLNGTHLVLNPISNEV